jgi:WD40 repeat protein
VTRAEFTTDGKRIISVGRDYHMNEWDVSKVGDTAPSPSRSVRIPLERLNVIEISQDAKWIAGGTGAGKVKVWETSSGDEDFAAKQDRSKPILDLVFSADSQNVFSRTDDGWSVLRQRDQILGHPKRTIVGGLGSDRRAIMVSPIVDNGLGPVPKRSSNPRKTDSVTFEQIAVSPDGCHVAGVIGNSVALYDLEAKEFVQWSPRHPKSITALAFSHNGKWLATDGDDRTLQIWETMSGKRKASLRGHSSGLTSLRVNKDDTRVAASGEDGNVYVWAVGDGLAE